MPDINLPIAFTAGVISFFAPCVVPLLPAYIGYITGVSFADLKKFGYGPYVKKVLLSSLFYILGFSIVFVLLGSAAAGIGIALRRYGWLIQRAGGILIIVFGLEFAGILNIPFLARQFSFRLPERIYGVGYLRAFLVGIIFATAWTPCIGVILGSILTLAAVSKTLIEGSLLLFVYSLGISFPFVLVSLTLAWAPRYLTFISRFIGPISRVSGIFLAFVGLLLLTDTYKYLNAWIFNIIFRFGFQIR